MHMSTTLMRKTPKIKIIRTHKITFATYLNRIVWILHRDPPLPVMKSALWTMNRMRSVESVDPGTPLITVAKPLVCTLRHYLVVYAPLTNELVN